MPTKKKTQDKKKAQVKDLPKLPSEKANLIKGGAKQAHHY